MLGQTHTTSGSAGVATLHRPSRDSVLAVLQFLHACTQTFASPLHIATLGLLKAFLTYCVYVCKIQYRQETDLHRSYQ